MTSPHTELRALWSTAGLTLGIYSADEDLRADDGVVVRLQAAAGPIDVRIPTKGQAGCGAGCELPRGLVAAVDVDGTFDNPADDDEEWLVELQVPWAALGLTSAPASVQVNVTRTDTPKGTTPRTEAWACAGPDALGQVVLEPARPDGGAGAR